MDGEAAAARAHPAVIASVVVAAVAVAACALVAIAWMLGWVPSRASVPTPAGIASPGQQVAGTVHDVDLLPGETLVAPPEAPKPAAPQYAKPLAEPLKTTPPPYGRMPDSAAKKLPAPTKPSYAQTLPSRAVPQEAARPPLTSYERATRGICINCGAVAAITSHSDDEWDVRVRFEDGSSETIRYRTRPPLRIGQRVHLEEGRLIPE